MDAGYAELDLTGCGLGQQEVNSFNPGAARLARPQSETSGGAGGRPMLRRGSTVRVRQGALRSLCKWVFMLSALTQ